MSGGNPQWRKSSYSGSQGGDCVEVAAGPRGIHVRDSKNTARPALHVEPQAWSNFLAYAHEGAGARL